MKIDLERKMKRTFVCAALVFGMGFPFTFFSLFAQQTLQSRAAKPFKTVAADKIVWIPNRLSVPVSNAGQFVHFDLERNRGLKWFTNPEKRVGKNAAIELLSEAGIWLAGIKGGDTLVATADYQTEFVPGNIQNWAPGSPGVAADTSDPRLKIYIINQQDLENPYDNPDYLNWPNELGAPVDKNGRPLLIGTSTLWTVFNDFDSSAHFNFNRYQTNPLGVEVQMTAWALNTKNALQNILYYQFRFINRSGEDISEMYAGFHSDPDISGRGRELVGCDTTLSLAYCYKTEEEDYFGENSPAVGMKLLDAKMASFQKIINAGSRLNQEPGRAKEVLHVLKGLTPLGDSLINPMTGNTTSFWHPGDPVTGEGWIDDDHRNKRWLFAADPFALADGDSHKVTLAIIIARGKTGLNSVTWLKRYAQVAQYAYDVGFALPAPPPSPGVVAYADSDAIVLRWDQSAEQYLVPDRVNIDSTGRPTAYTFQGYNVYQLEDGFSDVESYPRKIAIFDIVDGVTEIRDEVFLPDLQQRANIIVEKGRDSGIQRFLRIVADALHDNAHLIKNQPYFFAVTAYGYNPFGVPRILESPIRPIEARPQSLPLGTRPGLPFGDSLAVSHIGSSDGRAYAIVVLPGELASREYSVIFHQNEADKIVWDIHAGADIAVSGWENQGEQGENDFPIVDGVLVQVFGAPLGIHKVMREFEGGPRWVSGTNWGGSHLFGGMDLGARFLDFGSTVQPSEYVTVDWRFTKNPTMSEETGWSRCYVYRRDLGYAAVAERGWAPFQVFDMSDSTHPRQLNVCFVEDANGGLADGIWNPIAAEQTGGDPGGREYTFIMSSSYDPDGNIYDDDNWGPAADVLYALWPNNRGSHPYQEADFTMRIIPNFVNTERDTFRFRSEAPIRNDLALARKQAAALVNVFPNPVNRGLIDLRHPLDKKVTFTHLPLTGVVIRIYSLTGDLIRTIEHDNGTQFDFWDLRNANGRAVASGVYLVHVDMGEVGVKVLKVVVL